MWSWLWKLHTPNKVKYFIWKLLHNRLPSNSNLARVGLHVNPYCLHCNNQVEDSYHIFFNCTKAADLWNELTAKVKQPCTLKASDFAPHNWYHTWKRVNNKRFDNLILWNKLFFLCFWTVWLNRNDDRFKGNNINASFIQAGEYAYLKANSKPARNISSIMIGCKPPLRGFKLNIDGSCRRNPGKEGIWGVIRNHNGN